MSTAPSIHGVLVTFNRPRELNRTLRLLAGQTRPLDRLLVIDNAPGPETRAIVHGHTARATVEYVAAPENLGPAGGIALGMQRVLAANQRPDWLLLLDDDDPPYDAQLLARLCDFARAACEADPRTGAIGLAGARLDARRGRLIRIDNDELAGMVPVDYIGGGQMPLYRIDAVRATGAFATDLFFGFDDLEYGLRLRNAGYRLYAHGDLWRARRQQFGRLTHSVRPSVFVRRHAGTWRHYYAARNLTYVLWSQGHTRAAARVLLRTFAKAALNLLWTPPAPAWRHLRLTWRAGFDALAGRMGRTVEPEVQDSQRSLQP